MAQLFAGTSGFAYTAWKPEFYPQKVASKDFLKYYATRLNAVEINYTFRQLPKAATPPYAEGARLRWDALRPSSFYMF